MSLEGFPHHLYVNVSSALISHGHFGKVIIATCAEYKYPLIFGIRVDDGLCSDI